MLANHRRRINYVEELIIGNNCIKGNEALYEGAKKHFQNLYYEDSKFRPKLDNLSFNSVNEREKAQLEEKFTEEEILDCPRECDGDKAPGPDGFNIKFFQTFWDIIKGDIFEFFNDFRNHSSFVRSLNFSFLIMIPKKLIPRT